MRNKKIVLPVLVGLLLIGIIFGTGYVSAQDTTDGQTTFVQKLAEKLGISQDKVQTALDEIHTERHALMLQNMESKLNQAVSDGKINDTQKQAILNKMKEMEGNRPEKIEDFKNMTDAERRQAMEQKKTEMENWAKENGLTLETLHDLLGGPHKGLFFKMHKPF